MFTISEKYALGLAKLGLVGGSSIFMIEGTFANSLLLLSASEESIQLKNYLPGIDSFVNRMKNSLTDSLYGGKISVENPVPNPTHKIAAKLAEDEDNNIEKEIKLLDETSSETGIGSYFLDGNGIAHYMVSGVLTKRPNCMAAMLDGQIGTVQHRQQIREIKNNPDVKGLFLTIESPGGDSMGVFDFANDIYKLGKEIPVATYAEDMALSAGFLLFSQGTYRYGSQTAKLGSVGVYTELISQAEMLKDKKVDVRVIQAGKYKAIGHPAKPIDELAVKQTQKRVDETHKEFLSAIQNVTSYTKDQLDTISTADIFSPKEAIKLGMIKGYGSYEAAYSDFLKSSGISKTKTKINSVSKGKQKMDDELELGEEELLEVPTTPVVEPAIASAMSEYLIKNNITDMGKVQKLLSDSINFGNYMSSLQTTALSLATQLGHEETDYIQTLPYKALLSTLKGFRAQMKSKENSTQTTSKTSAEKITEANKSMFQLTDEAAFGKALVGG